MCRSIAGQGEAVVWMVACVLALKHGWPGVSSIRSYAWDTRTFGSPVLPCLSLPLSHTLCSACYCPSHTKATFPPQPISVLILNKIISLRCLLWAPKGRFRGKNPSSSLPVPVRGVSSAGQWPSCCIQYRPQYRLQYRGGVLGQRRVRIRVSE